MRLWLALVVVCLSSVTASAALQVINPNLDIPLVSYTCSQMKSDYCSKGTCPTGEVCSSIYAVSYVGSYCGCVSTTTTTLMPCTISPKNEQCAGSCPKGSVCTASYGKCGCYQQTTTTLRSTTTTFRSVNLPNAGDLLNRLTTTTISTRITLPPLVTITIPRIPDRDGDGVQDSSDNCPDTPNGPNLGTCLGANRTTCHSNADCGSGGFCSMDQMDFDIDGVGDACDLCQCISCTEGTQPGVDFYNFNDKNGCGCDDSDGGRNIFQKGTISRATPPAGDSVEMPPTPAELKGIPPSDHIGTETLSPALVASKTAALDKARAKFSAVYVGALEAIPSTPQTDYKPTHYTDFCKNDNTLVEYYCNNTGLHSEDVTCPRGCVGGRCRCGDIGDGDNPFQYDTVTNDYCSGGTLLHEGYYLGDIPSGSCTLVSKTYNCVLGCSGGKCVCGDTDGGVNVTGRGTTALNHTDFCHDIHTLVEYSISFSNSTTCRDTFQNIPCSGSTACYDGACKPASCLDGIQDGDETGVDCGGTWCPKCSPCVTGAKWAPTDGPCTHKWPTSDGPGIGMNTGSDSCNLVEVCDNNLDYIVTDALRCCENQDYGSVLTEPRKSSKENSCNWARTTSGLNMNVNPQNFKRCLGLYAISAFGYSAIYMQGYFTGEWCCYDSDKLCSSGCSHFRVKPAAWEMGTSASCKGDGGAHPDFHMGGHRCEYYSFIVDWGKAGHWSSDTDWRANSDSVVDVPAHASILRLSTGTCVDYSFAVTTILRKLGYSRDEVFSVNGEGHGYNLVRFPGDVKYHYVDTVGNRGNEVLGGSGFIPIVNQSAPGKPKLAWYDYCRKLDAGCSNDYYSQSTGNCPSNNNIFSCEGVPR